MLPELIAEGLGRTFVALLAKLIGRAAGSRRARVCAAIERFGSIGSFRLVAVTLLLFAAAAGAGIGLGFGPVFAALGLLVILLLATQLISGLCRLVAERMEEDLPELAERS